MASSTIQSCPDCSRVVRFTDDETHYIVCSSCGTTLRRKDDGTLLSIKQPVVLHKASVVQPGTTGTWKEKSFTVLGRFRCWFEEAVFSYWTIQLYNGDIALLAEGYGLYMVMEKSPADTSRISSEHLNNLQHGAGFKLSQSDKYYLEKKQQCQRWELEGEAWLPFTVPTFRSYDFAAQNGTRLSILETSQGNILAFDGFITSFTELKLQQLRTYENPGKQFECSKCTNTVYVQTYPFAQSCACRSCNRMYSLESAGDFKKVKDSAGNQLKPILPLGSKGVLNNTHYEVIGFVQKEEMQTYHSRWREYTLFNATEGYAFLSEYDGHWIFLRENLNCPVELNQNTQVIEFGDRDFELFNAYEYNVEFATGEFPYNIYDNNQTKAREFISPPYIWIQEHDGKEGIKWYAGEHITKETLQKAFTVAYIPMSTGVGAVQPTGHISFYKVAVATLLAAFLFLGAHMIIGGNKQERELYTQQLLFDSTNKATTVTGKFELDKWRSNIRFDIYAPVSNSWVEVGLTLVNATTGKEYGLEKGVEYYTGYTDGESWNEGSMRSTAYLTRIPSGTYFVQIEAVREPLIGPENCIVTITYDVPNHRNLIIPLILLLIWPIGKYTWSYLREKTRWSNSPFSKYEE